MPPAAQRHVRRIQRACQTLRSVTLFLFPSCFPFPPPRPSSLVPIRRLRACPTTARSQHTDRIDRRHQALSQKKHLHSCLQLPSPNYTTTRLPPPSPLLSCLGTLYLQPTSLSSALRLIQPFPALLCAHSCVLPPLKPLPLSLPLITLCARMTKFRLASAYSFHPALPPPGAHKR